MTGPSAHEITQLLQAWGNGDEQALEKLTLLVYDELHEVAHRYMARQAPDHILQSTALVNEVYLRLVDVRGLTWQNRAHFFAVCAKLMRRISPISPVPGAPGSVAGKPKRYLWMRN